MNTADKRSVRKAGQKAKHARREELKDLREVLGTSAGRRVVWRQLSQAGVFRLSFVYEETQTTAFNEGRRSMGLSLMADIHELDPELYVTMAREAQQATKQDETITEAQAITEEENPDE